MGFADIVGGQLDRLVAHLSSYGGCQEGNAALTAARK
jgi:hypothetical protein